MTDTVRVVSLAPASSVWTGTGWARLTAAACSGVSPAAS